MIADRLPCSLVHIDDTTVEVVVSSGKDIERSEDFKSHLVAILDEISEHIIIARTLHAFPISHIRSNLAVIKNLAHDGFHIDHHIGETEILAFLKIKLNGIRMRECRIIGFTVEPHVIMILESFVFS